MTTESPSEYQHLETLPTAQLLAAMNQLDHTVPQAVASALPQIEALVEATVARLRAGGRLGSGGWLGAGRRLRRWSVTVGARRAVTQPLAGVATVAAGAEARPGLTLLVEATAAQAGLPIGALAAGGVVQPSTAKAVFLPAVRVVVVGRSGATPGWTRRTFHGARCPPVSVCLRHSSG